MRLALRPHLPQKHYTFENENTKKKRVTSGARTSKNVGVTRATSYVKCTTTVEDTTHSRVGSDRW
jgi:hypothetical protein